MNNILRTEAKNDFEKDFCKLMNSSVFGKTMENVRKCRDIKLIRTDKRKNNENLLAIEMNKPVYLGMLKLDISKTLMYEFY